MMMIQRQRARNPPAAGSSAAPCPAPLQAEPLLPVFPGARLRAYPRPGFVTVEYLPLSTVLTQHFDCDAHTSSYSCPSLPHRLLVDTYRLGPTTPLPEMHAIFFDVDSVAAHTSGDAAHEVWFQIEERKITELLSSHPGGFVYRTRRGYRVVYRVEPGIVIDGEDAALAWRGRYIRSLVFLARAFGIICDGSCKSWNWLFRLPHATRDPHAGPERRETIGDARAVGIWGFPRDS